MKNKILRFFFAVAGIAFLAVLGASHLYEDSFIISAGISALRTIRLLSGIIGGLLLAGVGISTIVSLIVSSKAEKEAENESLRQAQMEEDARREREAAQYNKAALETNGRMDPPKVRAVLVKQAEQSTEDIKDSLMAIVGQMEAMDGSQARLHGLLEMNGASKLKDSEDALDEAEQAMCRNVRRVLNVIAAGASKEECASFAKNTFKANDAILNKAGDFVLQLAKYLNSQGSSSDNMFMLDSYKNAITEVLQEQCQEQRQ